ncbi:hypothetical protein [Paenibacillus eucommiae]|uniref:Uncharacterized protein n=1 Tax=Paenibacillus eucommiae TaxID=1355755 RepID=A0ABS4IYN0_9BACL|nr:hypothetical protein [Paenibacillus eucommiae]MBP1992692.1 hypothetical protein [Paenibacillus eucommiae]
MEQIFKGGRYRSSAHSHSLSLATIARTPSSIGKPARFFSWLEYIFNHSKALGKKSARSREGSSTLTMFFIVKSIRSAPHPCFNDEKPSMTFVAYVTTKNENSPIFV